MTGYTSIGDCNSSIGEKKCKFVNKKVCVCTLSLSGAFATTNQHKQTTTTAFVVRNVFTAYTVSHVFASLCSCSILSFSFLSSSFLRASSAYHAVEIDGEQDWLT